MFWKSTKDDEPSTSGGSAVKNTPVKDKASTESSSKTTRFEIDDTEKTLSLEDAATINYLARKRTSMVHSFRSTSYIETLIHLLKGNIGSGMMAMGYAFANGGLILAPILTLILAVICIHAQHLLVIAAAVIKLRADLERTPNFANTIEFAFTLGPARVRRYAPHLRAYVLIALCVTQLGFCCAYIVFIGHSLIKIVDFFEVTYDPNTMYLIMVAAIILPILLTCWIRDLKYLVPFSFLANILMVFGITLTIYLMSKGLSYSDIHERAYAASYTQLPLYMGTTIYSFEGISLVLPLQKQMKEETQFGSKYGVLNVGMSIVTLLLIVVGTLGYMRYGDEALGSLNLNLPQTEVLTLCINMSIALGVLLTFALMMHVPVLIVVPALATKYGPFKHPLIVDTVIRTLLVLLTFAMAVIVPHLELVIALVGSVASTSLALMLPAMVDTVIKWDFGITKFTIVKNMLIFIVGIIVFVTGTIMSVLNIVYVIVESVE